VAERVSDETMESAAELHEARVLRGQIEVHEARLAALPADAPEVLRTACLDELSKLKADYRRVLAGQADRDYRRRRAEWRVERRGSRNARRSGLACA
jgi:hypothetical protein